MPVETPDEFRTVAYWDEIIQRDPFQSIVQANIALESDDELGVAVLAWWAISRAQLDLGRLAEAQRAARHALEALAPDVDAEVRSAVVLSSAVILAEAGDIDTGLAVLDGFVESTEQVTLARVDLQRAYILHHAGRLVEALTYLDRGERLFGSSAHPRDLFRLHNQRGVVLLQQGRFEAAESDFNTAEEIARDGGLTAARALTIANRAVLYGRARRLAESVRTFEDAVEAFGEIGNPGRMVALAEIDRAEVMMHSGLVLDAVGAAGRAIEFVEPTGNRVLLGDATLVLARAQLAASSTHAGATAERAAAIFAATGRHDMVVHASAVATLARLRSAKSSEAAESALDAARLLAEQFRAQGWHRQADELGLERLRVAFRFGQRSQVEADLSRLRLGAVSDQRDVALAGLLAEAIGCALDGDSDAGMAATKRGLDRLDDIVVEAATLEERSAVMRLGADLSQMAIELAIGMGDADTVLAAAEGTRARALHDELSERERHRPLTESGAERLRRELTARLDRSSLVEWLVVRDRIMAVIVDAGGSRLVEVAPVVDVVRARDRVLAQLDVATSDPDARTDRAVRATEAFDELVLAPLGLADGTGVVMVPVDVMHGVPWSGMPTLVDRSLVLSPNAQLWLEADRRAGLAVRRVGLIVGPDVAGGDTEQATIERLYPSAAIASGAGASAAALASMLRGYGLVHVAAHGRFRSDRPLLSTLRLVDGESTLHDTIPERVNSQIVVLSSCEGGAQGTSAGSEVLGLGAVLLARGAATVVAPLTTVRDLECAEFIADVHAELAASTPSARALANVRSRWLVDDDLSRWAVASSFSCFGSGASRVQA